MTNQTMTETLDKCKHCAGKAELGYRDCEGLFYIYCTACLISTAEYATSREARKIWNTRSDQPAVSEQAKAVIKDVVAKRFEADGFYDVARDIIEETICSLNSFPKTIPLVTQINTLMLEALKYVWERVYLDANGKYMLKEPFDLQAVIDVATAAEAKKQPTQPDATKQMMLEALKRLASPEAFGDLSRASTHEEILRMQYADEIIKKVESEGAK